jgi:hypothetical protein
MSFNAVCLQASQGDSRKANLLMRFVLGHELSHIKHGDCAVMSWLTLFYTDIKVVLVAGALSSVICILLKLQKELIGLIAIPFVLTLMCLPFLKWTIARIARYRELMADARSSQLFDHNETEQMIKSDTVEMLSPLEFLIAYFSIRFQNYFYSRKNKWLNSSRFCYATMGWTEAFQPTNTGILQGKLREALTCFHPSINDRHMALHNQEYTGESLPSPSWSSAIQIQLIASLSFTLLVACSLLATFPLVAEFVTPLKAKDLTLCIFGGMSIFVLICFPALAFSLPARVSSKIFYNHAKYILSLAKKYLAGTGFGLLVLLPILALIMKSSPPSFITKLSDSYLAFIAIFIVCQFAGLMLSILLSGMAPYGSGAFSKAQIISNNLILLPVFLVAIGITIPIIPVLGGLEFLLGVCGGCAVASYMAPKIEGGDYLQQILAIRIRNLCLCLDSLSYRRWAYILFMGIWGMPFAVGAWLTAFFWHLLIVLFMRGGSVSSSGLVVIFGMLLFLLLIVFFHTQNRRRIAKSIAFILTCAYQYMRVINLAEYTVATKAIQKLTELLRGNQNSNGAFPNRRGSPLAFIEANYYACYCLSNVGNADFNRQNLINWIMKCQHPDGGYGAYPRGIPRLASTYWALSILQLLSYSAPNTDRDVAWVLAKGTSDGQFIDPNSKHSPIHQTWYAIKCLECLGAVDYVNRTKVEHCTRTVLDYDALDIWDAVSAIDVLQVIGVLDDASRQKVFRRFVNPAFIDIYRLPIHQHISWLVAYTKLLDLTKSIYPEEAKLALKLLGERVSQAFDSYMQSV